MKDCEGVVMHEDGPNRYLFIMLNVGPQAMNLKYECEFTIKVNDVDYTKKGTPTILIAGEFNPFFKKKKKKVIITQHNN